MNKDNYLNKIKFNLVPVLKYEIFYILIFSLFLFENGVLGIVGVSVFSLLYLSFSIFIYCPINELIMTIRKSIKKKEVL